MLIIDKYYRNGFLYKKSIITTKTTFIVVNFLFI